MGKTYKTRLEFDCWKQQTCADCGCVFRYRFARTKTGSGATQEKASTAASDAVVRALTDEVDTHPCPGCGVIQADMIASARAARHVRLALFSSVGLAALFMLAIPGLDMIGTHVCLGLAGGLCVLAMLGHVCVVLRNENANLAANRERAEAELAAQVLELENEGERESPPRDRKDQRLRLLHIPLFLGLVLGVLFLVSGEIVRTMNGWPLNSDWHPHVVGPGDQAYIFFPQTITSMKGYWNGTPKVLALNATELGLSRPELQAASYRGNWAEVIPRPARLPRTSSSTLWLRVQIPAKPDLAGKLLQLRMDLGVAYPIARGSSPVETETGSFSHQAELRLADPEAGAQYQRLVWWGGLAGAVTTILSSLGLIFLARAGRKEALATTIIPITE